MSAIFANRSETRKVSPLGQLVSCDVQTKCIVRRIGHCREVIQQIQRLQDRCDDADADRGVSVLDTRDRGARGRRALSHDCHGEPAPQAGVANALLPDRAKPADRLAGGATQTGGGRRSGTLPLIAPSITFWRPPAVLLHPASPPRDACNGGCYHRTTPVRGSVCPAIMSRRGASRRHPRRSPAVTQCGVSAAAGLRLLAGDLWREMGPRRWSLCCECSKSGWSGSPAEARR